MFEGVRQGVAKWRRRFETVASKVDGVDVLVFGGIGMVGVGVTGEFGPWWAAIVVGASLAALGWRAR